MIITIDGPAGSGKSSVSRALAKSLKYIHLNSGLLYRAVYYICDLQGVDMRDRKQVELVLAGCQFDFTLNMVDFHTEIRAFYAPNNLEMDLNLLLSDRCSQGASKVGVLPYVRDVLTQFQRKMGESKDLVLEGRDAGSIVFPNADYKFYLDASLEERVRRRFLQEQSIGKNVSSDTEEQILFDMQARDERDRTRAIAPQVVPDNAIVVDTTHLQLDEVVEVLRLHIQNAI